MRKKTIIIALGGVALIVSVGLAYWLWPGPDAPEPAEQTPQQITAFMASKEFEKLDPAKKQEYFNKARERLSAERSSGEGRARGRMLRGELSEEQRERLRKNVQPLQRRMMEERLDKFFELPPEQRTAYLDEMIDRMAEMRAQREKRRREQGQSASRPSDRERDRGGRRRGFTPERMKRMIEKTPPERRAKFAEFMKAFRKRMEERGISFRSRPHRRP